MHVVKWLGYIENLSICAFLHTQNMSVKKSTNWQIKNKYQSFFEVM